MFEKMILNDSFGRIWDRYNNPWGFPINLECSNKVISREPMPIGVATVMYNSVKDERLI